MPMNYGDILMSTRSNFDSPFGMTQVWDAGLLRQHKQAEPFAALQEQEVLYQYVHLSTMHYIRQRQSDKSLYRESKQHAI
ncbi:hypothetical protein BGZ94_000718 [Podila epigama]|nr:hypothetical protein BGZ94_000718 [Podila epigama]